jgi:hypothetical protein
MAGNLQLYTILYVTTDGSLLQEEQTVSVARTTNAQLIHTVAKGMSGVSPGSPIVEWDVESAVPAVGFEFDAGKKMIGLIPTQLYMLGPGGFSLKGNCFIISDSLTGAVDSPTKYTFKAVGPMVLWAQ